MTIVLSDKYKSMEASVGNMDSLFRGNETYIHRARNIIKLIDIDGMKCVVKSFRIPNIINKIVYTFLKPSKAKRSFEYSVRLGDFSPEPIGYIETYRYGLLDKSYFLAVPFSYHFTIREPLLNTTFPERTEIFAEFARFTARLHRVEILHLDYSPGNILIKRDSNGYIFKIVDLNRMKFGTLSRKERLANFAQLWAEDDDLKQIVRVYADAAGDIGDTNQAVAEALVYSRQHKEAKERKKRLKRLLGWRV